MEETIKINNKGVEHFLNKDFEKAEAEYGKALGIDPQNTTALNNLGLLHHQKKEYDKAVELFTKAIKVHSKDTYHLNLANSLAFLGKYTEAEDNYKQCLSQNPDNENAKISLARFYEIIGRVGDATKIWAQLAYSSPKEFYKIELAKNYMTSGKYENALSVLNNLDSISESAVVDFHIGVCHFNLQNYGMAEAAFKKSLGNEPDNYKTRHYLAMNYLSKGDYSSAIKELDFLIKMNPENLKVKLDKASLLLNFGDYPKALLIIDSVLNVDPKNEKALHYKSLVSELNQKKDKK